MINIFICDDEPKMLSDISAAVAETAENCDITAFSGGSELLSALSEKDCDLLLLDIDMPGLSGLDIAKTLSGREKRPVLVFVTSHDELVYDSLQFHPFGFVRKSHLKTELSRVLEDAVKEISGRQKHFCFRSAEGNVRLLLDDIMYFESEGNYIKLYAKSGEYRFRETVTALENSLGTSGFVRIHKGFLVNHPAVKMVNTEECVLYSGVRLPVGRSYSEKARKQLMRYMLK